MQLVEVTDAQTASAFILVNVEINQHDPHYIRPLNKDVSDVFDPRKNQTFEHGQVARWILQDDQGKPIGRIAAFINQKYRNKGDEIPVGGVGFFDCIDSQEAADLLFDVARHWLLQRGMEAMDGPINFGERDRWWGLVVAGFEEPLYCMNFNPPYYKTLFEQYGFKPFYNQLCFSVDPKRSFHKKFHNRHAVIAKDPDYTFIKFEKQRLGAMAEAFTKVYNKAWSGHDGLKELHKDQVLQLFRQMKPVIDEHISWFVFHRGQPVGTFLNLPDLNQWFKYLHGKFNWWHRLKLLRIKRTKTNTKIVGLVFGVIPEYQGKGIDAYMIVEAGKILQQLDYREYEMQWIGDFNPKMINVAKHFGDTHQSRTLTTYRYLFDQLAPFKVHPVLE